MKPLEEDSNFPIQPKSDLIREKIANEERTVGDISEKEKQLFVRIYSFTSEAKLREKFGLTKSTYNNLCKKLKEEGYTLRKNESYARAVVKPNPENKPTQKSETPGHLLSAFMNTVSEEERRELMVMYEEGMDPVELMKQLITIQGARVVRGHSLERNGSQQLHKTMNEATADMTTMIYKLHEMEEGIKQVHGFDDSFLGIMLALQKRGKEGE